MHGSNFRTTSLPAGHALRTAALIWCAMSLGLFTLTTTASADSVQLAQTVPKNADNGDFVFTNSGSSGSFTADSPVKFDFTPSDITGTLPSQLTGDLDATIDLSATTSSSAGLLFGVVYVQPIDTGTLQIILDTPINGLDNLLTVNFTNATIAGPDGNPAFSDQDGLGGATVTYSSDFLTFGGTTTGNNFLTPMFADLSIGAGNFLDSFTANGISTFGFDNSNLTVSVVPEPSSIVLLGLGAIALAGLARRKMRKGAA
jgi:hypothetical protein